MNDPAQAQLLAPSYWEHVGKARFPAHVALKKEIGNIKVAIWEYFKRLFYVHDGFLMALVKEHIELTIVIFWCLFFVN